MDDQHDDRIQRFAMSPGDEVQLQLAQVATVVAQVVDVNGAYALQLTMDGVPDDAVLVPLNQWVTIGRDAFLSGQIHAIPGCETVSRRHVSVRLTYGASGGFYLDVEDLSMNGTEVSVRMKTRGSRNRGTTRPTSGTTVPKTPPTSEANIVPGTLAGEILNQTNFNGGVAVEGGGTVCAAMMSKAEVARVGAPGESQDAFLAWQVNGDCLVLAIFDGLGGHDDGKAAAETARDALQEILKGTKSIKDPGAFFVKALNHMKGTLDSRFSRSNADTTATIAMVRGAVGSQEVAVVGTGDSLAFVVGPSANTGLLQINDDHSGANMRFEPNGSVTLDSGAGSLLLSSLRYPKEGLKLWLTRLKTGQCLALTSDGITGDTRDQVPNMLELLTPLLTDGAATLRGVLSTKKIDDRTVVAYVPGITLGTDASTLCTIQESVSTPVARGPGSPGMLI